MFHWVRPVIGTLRFELSMTRLGEHVIGDSYCCVGKLSNPVSAAHPVFASAEPEYGYRSGQFGAGSENRTRKLTLAKL